MTRDDLWVAALAFVHEHPDAPEGIEFWQVNHLPGHVLNDTASAPGTPREGTVVGSSIPGTVSQRLEYAEGEVSGVPFTFAWSREAQRVFLALPPSHDI
ncbi:MAG TPA: hypothetical protein VFJ16_31190 [Longimicrobium sp.]|nr:hypothetical protein [Longimicrobium sp.]